MLAPGLGVAVGVQGCQLHPKSTPSTNQHIPFLPFRANKHSNETCPDQHSENPNSPTGIYPSHTLRTPLQQHHGALPPEPALHPPGRQGHADAVPRGAGRPHLGQRGPAPGKHQPPLGHRPAPRPAHQRPDSPRRRGGHQEAGLGDRELPYEPQLPLYHTPC